MTKRQKIWLWVSVAMLVVPEVLWSPITNYIFSFFAPTIMGSSQILRNSFLFDYKYESLLGTMLFIQLAGILFFFFNWLRFGKNLCSRFVFWGILGVTFLLCVISLFVLYLGIIININFP